MASPKIASLETVKFPLAPTLAPSKRERLAARNQNGPGVDPNVLVPKKLIYKQSNHPTSGAQGTPNQRSLMKPQPLAAGHPFFDTLHEWGNKGIPVDCGPDWEWEVINQAVLHGPHQSALDLTNITLVHQDIQYQVDAGFLRVVLWSDLEKVENLANGSGPPERPERPLNPGPLVSRLSGTYQTHTMTRPHPTGGQRHYGTAGTGRTNQGNRKWVLPRPLPTRQGGGRRSCDALKNRSVGWILGNDCSG
jgi:hypothetical protein